MKNLIIIILLSGLNGFGQKSDKLFFDLLAEKDTMSILIDPFTGGSSKGSLRQRYLGGEDHFVLLKNGEFYSLAAYLHDSKTHLPIVVTLKSKDIKFIRNFEKRVRSYESKSDCPTQYTWWYKDTKHTQYACPNNSRLYKIFKDKNKNR